MFFTVTILMKRLDEIISLIGSSKGVADIGTDHGYLPVKLALSGFQGFLFASDVNQGPLCAAKRVAEEKGVSEKITFSLSDGLSACEPQNIDCIVIAGMGGDLISAIISRAKWAYSEAYHLILQPMTKPEVLRAFLIQNGFHIVDERLVKENSRIFTIISARYSDKALPEKLSDAEMITGAYSLISKSELFPELISRELRRLEKKITGRSSAGITSNSENAEYIKCIQISKQMNEMQCRFNSSVDVSE